MKDRLILYLIMGWILTSFVFFTAAVQWQRAYDQKPYVLQSGIKYLEGRLTYSPTLRYHILIGYEAHGCMIEPPPTDNVISDVNISNVRTGIQFTELPSRNRIQLGRVSK